jgi:hypothetical protein
MTTAADYSEKLEPQLGMTTKAGGYGSLRSAGRTQ